MMFHDGNNVQTSDGVGQYLYVHTVLLQFNGYDRYNN